MDGVIYRTNNADSYPIKNQSEDLDYRRRGQKETNDEKRIPEKKHLAIGTNTRVEADEDEEEDKEEVGGTLTHQKNMTVGLCAICHLTPGNAAIALNKNVPCSKEHTLCHGCIQHFAIRSGTGCLLCRTQSQLSETSFSRESTTSLNSFYLQSLTTRDTSKQKRESYCNQRLLSRTAVNADEPNSKMWSQNYGGMMLARGNELENVNTNDYEIESSYGQEKRNNVQERYLKSRDMQQSQEQQQRSYCSLMRKEDGDPCASEIRVNGQITTECSRRPIRCPRMDCGINVAFSALTHHFIFDHPEIPILSVEPGTKSTLIVSFAALTSDSSRCLALLLVSGKLSEPVARLFSGSQINAKYRNRLPLPVLAARLNNAIQYSSSYDIHDVDDNCHEKDVIIAWVAGLNIGNTKERLRCSIQAVDSINSVGLRSLTYTGPVNSLRTAQSPREIFLNGDCIVLHEGLLNRITSDCTNLNISIIVH